MKKVFFITRKRGFAFRFNPLNVSEDLVPCDDVKKTGTFKMNVLSTLLFLLLMHKEIFPGFQDVLHGSSLVSIICISNLQNRMLALGDFTFKKACSSVLHYCERILSCKRLPG